MSKETISPSVQNFTRATIEHKINADKYTVEVKETFIVNASETGDTFRIKKTSMLEMAELHKKNSNSINILIRDGYPARDKMKAGAGIACKMIEKEEEYECIFFEGAEGEKFNVDKIKRKSFISLDKNHLNAIFTFLLCNEEVVQEKAEAKKIQRTTLNLD